MAVAIATTSLAGCDKIKDATSKDIKVNGVKFDFTAVTTEGGATKSGGMVKTDEPETSNFGVTRLVDIKELSPEVEEYCKQISNVEADNSRVTVTINSQDAFTVTNLKIAAPGVTGSPQVILLYTSGTVYEASPAMNTFMAALAKKLLDEKVSVTVSCDKIDVPADITVKISYESDMVFKAKLL
jgi:hypothetical protein